MKVNAIIVAAGEGKRLGQGPKAYVVLSGRPVLLRALDKFRSAGHVEKIIVVAAGAEVPRCEAMLRSDAGLEACTWIVQAGGATRQESVRRGLEKIDEDADVIAIHDGARPLVSTRLIERCIETAYARGAAAAGLPVRDTIKMVSEDGRVESTPDRARLWEIQTPQAFVRQWIVDAHARAAAEGMQATDDAMLVEHLARPVWIVEGERTNLKITLPEDLILAEALIRERRAS